jgi:cysteinyl-tRNA synthetase
MYVCGPTVYNHAHIGNARPVVAFDVLFRRLRALYGERRCTYARNVTDVDDRSTPRRRRGRRHRRDRRALLRIYQR